MHENLSSERFKEIIVALSSEILQMEMYNPTEHIPDSFVSYLEDLQCLFLTYGRTGFRNLVEGFEWLSRPLNEWGSPFTEWAQEEEWNDPMFINGGPSELVQELGEKSPFQKLDSLFKRFVNQAKQHQDPDTYSRVRRLICEQPYFADVADFQRNPLMSIPYARSYLRQCFDWVPQNRIRNGKLALCPYCRTPVRWRFDPSGWLSDCHPTCRSVCSGLRAQKGLLWKDKPDGAAPLMVKEHIHRDTVIPDQATLLILRTLERWNESLEAPIQVWAWPEFDATDLLLVFPDGERWSIDVKDYRNPVRLAREFHGIPSYGDIYYDQAFVVFPDHRKKHPHYLDQFLFHCSVPDLQACFVSEFLNRVRHKEEHS